ncbi:MAG: DNA mismatch endonuclease Vsr [Caldimonas sp.]
MDVVDSATRSRMMSGIHGRDTKIELRVRSSLHAQGVRYRLHNCSLPGRPDIVFTSRRAVVFSNGCYGHAHDCPLFRLPATNTDFWRTKPETNRQRDVRSLAALQAIGWRTAVVCECAIRGRPGAGIYAHLLVLADCVRAGAGNLDIRGPA